jgi:hypothetical protein
VLVSDPISVGLVSTRRPDDARPTSTEAYVADK